MLDVRLYFVFAIRSGKNWLAASKRVEAHSCLEGCRLCRRRSGFGEQAVKLDPGAHEVVAAGGVRAGADDPKVLEPWWSSCTCCTCCCWLWVDRPGGHTEAMGREGRGAVGVRLQHRPGGSRWPRRWTLRTASGGAGSSHRGTHAAAPHRCAHAGAHNGWAPSFDQRRYSPTSIGSGCWR